MAKLIKHEYSNEQLVAIVEEIKNAEPLLAQGLFREVELSDLYNRANQMYEASVDHDSIQYRKYDRARRETTRWREVSRSGYVDEEDGRELLEIKQQIIELLDLRNVEVQSEEIFIPPNSEYLSRIAIRNILSTAQSSIDIKDDYLFSVNKLTKNIELLMILHPYLGTSLSLTVRLLGSSDNLPVEVISDVQAFLKQHDSVDFKGYSHRSDGERQTHDRFIIIDGTQVYKIGTSIKDIGTSQSSIDKVNDQSVASEYIAQFGDWWKKAKNYDGLG